MQLRGPALRESISDALDAHGVEAGTVQLELSETVLLNNGDDAIAAMRAIRAAGLRIALDDFGTGRVGLRDLGRMPLDTVKVDRRFVSSFAADRVSAAVTEAIVAIGRTLGLEVVAEGIDSAESQALLHASGCRHMQGNYLCPPLPAHEFEHWYRQRLH
jgi:EAL domain-containing protein (putative c-di-GMP-specific phosphodiesterase class I)